MTERFPLRPRWFVLILAMVGFTACAAVLVHFAGRGRGLVINGLINLDAGEARVFLLALAAASMLLVVVGLLGALRQRGDRLAVEIDDETITVPGSLFRPAAQTIRFADITQMVDQDINGQVFRTLSHRGGKAWIHRQSLGETAFAQINRVLDERLKRR